MTKLFSSLEEVNEFLKGGKFIDHIELQAGMVAVSVAGQSAKYPEDNSDIVKEFIDNMVKGRVLSSYSDGVYCRDKGEFGLSLSKLPMESQITLLTSLVATSDGSSAGRRFFEDLLKKLQGHNRFN